MKIGDVGQMGMSPVQGKMMSNKAENAPAAPEKEDTPKIRKRDEYIPGEDEKEPIGLYSMGQDGEGNPKINYDAPDEKKPEQPDKDEKEKSESCTTNTDKVDREIKQLKEKQEKIKQQLKTADNEEKARQLEKQLAAIESELSQKDNDSYRRSQAVFS